VNLPLASRTKPCHPAIANEVANDHGRPYWVDGSLDGPLVRGRAGTGSLEARELAVRIAEVNVIHIARVYIVSADIESPLTAPIRLMLP
jgi:hypothetical protein